jgi:hypothetical protein
MNFRSGIFVLLWLQVAAFILLGWAVWNHMLVIIALTVVPLLLLPLLSWWVAQGEAHSVIQMRRLYVIVTIVPLIAYVPLWWHSISTFAVWLLLWGVLAALKVRDS